MIDWTALGEEAVDLLRRYLALDTTNPPGNETAGARFLADVLAAVGIATELAEAAPGRGNLVARLAGDGSRGGIVLHHHMVRTTFAVTMLRASEKRNVIPPEATADIDCRMLAGEDPDEIVAWVRQVVADDHVQVEAIGAAKAPNVSPPDTELYKAMAAALERRAPGAVVTPEVLVAFTDNWVFRRAGLHSYGFSPLVVDEEEVARVHGNDERVGVDNLRRTARHYTEMLLAVAAA